LVLFSPQQKGQLEWGMGPQPHNMPPGRVKTCFNCSFHTRNVRKLISKCIKHSFDLPEQETINVQHRFCSDFKQTPEAKKY
jgi:hypothetical protein